MNKFFITSIEYNLDEPRDNLIAKPYRWLALELSVIGDVDKDALVKAMQEGKEVTILVNGQEIKT